MSGSESVSRSLSESQSNLPAEIRLRLRSDSDPDSDCEHFHGPRGRHRRVRGCCGKREALAVRTWYLPVYDITAPSAYRARRRRHCSEFPCA